MKESRVGIFLEALPVSEIRRFARLADQRGFRSAWFPEITFADAFVPAAAASFETEAIHLATGVVGIWGRSPVAMALSAATLNQLCPGRLILGLGLQSRTYVENWHGRKYQRPLRAMREYIQILRGVLSGEMFSFEGEIFRVRGFQLQIPPPEEPIPIYMAAIGPRMLELAGEVADGVLGYCYSLPYLEQVVRPRLKAGAERVGRSLEGFEVACGLPALVAEDDRAFDQHKGQVLMFATAAKSSPFYSDSFARAGFRREVAEIQAQVQAGNISRALKQISNEMVDAVTLTGTPEHVRERIGKLHEAGVQTVVANPSPANVFFPLYEGHFPESVEFPPFSFPEFLATIERIISELGP